MGLGGSNYSEAYNEALRIATDTGRIVYITRYDNTNTWYVKDDPSGAIAYKAVYPNDTSYTIPASRPSR